MYAAALLQYSTALELNLLIASLYVLMALTKSSFLKY